MGDDATDAFLMAFGGTPEQVTKRLLERYVLDAMRGDFVASAIFPVDHARPFSDRSVVRMFGPNLDCEVVGRDRLREIAGGRR